MVAFVQDPNIIHTCGNCANIYLKLLKLFIFYGGMRDESSSFGKEKR